jgi:putative flavoprotein involved in K+ transport
MAALEEKPLARRDGFQVPLATELDLQLSGITNVVWATSYAFDFSLVNLPILDRDGFPIQSGGTTDYPGLYFVGPPWLATAKSGLLYGVGDSARLVAKNFMHCNRGVEGHILRTGA